MFHVSLASRREAESSRLRRHFSTTKAKPHAGTVPLSYGLASKYLVPKSYRRHRTSRSPKSRPKIGRPYVLRPTVNIWNRLYPQLQASHKSQRAHNGDDLYPLPSKVRSLAVPHHPLDSASLGPPESCTMRRLNLQRWWRESRDSRDCKATGLPHYRPHATSNACCFAHRTHSILRPLPQTPIPNPANALDAIVVSKPFPSFGEPR